MIKNIIVDTCMDDELKVFGEGEAVTIPNPLSISNKKYNFDYYCAMAAAQLYSLVDMEQFPNADDSATKIVNRTKIFANKVKSAFPDAFE